MLLGFWWVVKVNYFQILLHYWSVRAIKTRLQEFAARIAKACNFNELKKLYIWFENFSLSPGTVKKEEITIRFSYINVSSSGLDLKLKESLLIP